MNISLCISRDDGQGETGDSEWTGVARIHDGQVTGSGVLLSTGLHLLTVAHLLDELVVAEGEVLFDTPDGRVSRRILTTELYPEMLITEQGVWHDLALVTLEQAAPEAAARYALYTGDDEVGLIATLAGYGQAQDSGGVALPESGATRRAGENTIDSVGTPLALFAWHGSLDEQLFYDYDDGTVAHDTLGLLLADPDLGLGGAEAMITPGDSGGGLFVEQDGAWQVAGINSYVTRWASTDLTGIAEGSQGDVGVATRVSSYAEWIETSTGQLQTPVPQASTPPAPGRVPLQVAEGEGTWFLVQLRQTAIQPATVDFFTRDGSAVAGQDYIPTRGTLSLATGERWAAIWVQTLADDCSEGGETFSLVLVNPHGASFSGGQSELAAQRTIIDDLSLTGVTQLTDALWG
ncbi:MAG: Calx-beta domain-containing protein [Thermodesulfobacteriota bacterium]